MNGTENAAMRYQKTAPQMASADVHANIPALGWYTDEVLFAQNWERPELAKRDRSIVTVSAIVACNFTAQLVSHSKRALNFGVVGYRLSSKLVLPKGRVEDVIAQLKALGRDNLFKRTETLDREALRREPAELLCKLGAYINQTDEFYYDVSEAEAKEL